MPITRCSFFRFDVSVPDSREGSAFFDLADNGCCLTFDCRKFVAPNKNVYGFC